jgi:hypothetical protein
LKNNPHIIFNISKDKMKYLLDKCVECSINEKYKSDKHDVTHPHGQRRNLNLLDKILIGNYYRCKMPYKYIQNKYSTEHITPHSSIWEGKIDIDRIGNLFPTLDEINKKRGNKSISIYFEDYAEFSKNISEILPENYEEINEYKDKKSNIISNKKYNEYCSSNETLLIKTLMDDLYQTT